MHNYVTFISSLTLLTSDHRHGHHPRLHHPLSPPPIMAGIQEIADENGTISPVMGAASTPVVVQAPVPPQFADEPPSQGIQEDSSSDPLLNQAQDNTKLVANEFESMGFMKTDSERTNSSEQIPDRNMVSFLPMSDSIEDDSVVNLTRF